MIYLWREHIFILIHVPSLLWFHVYWHEDGTTCHSHDITATANTM